MGQYQAPYSFSDLPDLVLTHIFNFLHDDAEALFRCLQTNERLRRIAKSDTSLWKRVIASRWGFNSQLLEDHDLSFLEPKDFKGPALYRWVEKTYRAHISWPVKLGRPPNLADFFLELRRYGLMGDDCAGGYRRGSASGDLHLPSLSLVGRRFLAGFLSSYDFCGLNILTALRGLLLEFPFLPMDAGQGIDHLLYYFSQTYTLQPEEWPDLWTLKYYSSDESDDDDAPKKEDCPKLPIETLNRQKLMLSPTGQYDDFYAGCADLSGSEVYIILYALIMLNTDAHNPSIPKKITFVEWMHSIRQTEVGHKVPPEVLRYFFDSLQQNPLAIRSIREWITGTQPGSLDQSQRTLTSILPRTPQALWSDLTVNLRTSLIVWLPHFHFSDLIATLQPRVLCLHITLWTALMNFLEYMITFAVEIILRLAGHSDTML
ncbi:hypothetical protein CYMTET_45327 [Cymbomonas tetramitiformis]|uniref:F-box domain-containing protein n=1 Tax=Cymbomonas tetramitiformis TaxID=36881 RepID=A0AAE0C0I1_9CHLO|nr:hypothetical protein CYMTET_45329 [Cymbomonas tetramitiformis]KAK3245085.1 hypothetical protein CYMTET_45327 [Cymbomonas tetramitiformis]